MTRPTDQPCLHLKPGDPPCSFCTGVVDEREPCTCTVACQPQHLPEEHYCREEADCAN